MIHHVGLSTQAPLPAKPQSKGSPEKAKEAEPAVRTAELVVPSDPQGWQTFAAGRTRLTQDHPDSRAISAYMETANQGLRQELQSMMGVDLYV
ncbi:hypothetical protein [Ferrimonas futtsuensis]|uniref:hypothetical protein n=1 Tax=Ferrimonas futtsuensis TaxID=364764 RepID=UPI0004290F4D|nr:hypothetical protein [Ferrimonas futtsuensis]